MTRATLIQVAFGAGSAGLAAALVWLVAVFRCRSPEESSHREMHMELAEIIDQRCKEFSAQQVEMARRVESLETRMQDPIPALRGPIGRTDRSRAIQLLRSGLTPATVAVNLGLGAREIHLIAAVSRALSGHLIARDVHGIKEERPTF